MPVLIDAAVRSLLFALIVAAGLRAFRIRNVFAQKAAFGLVLAGALAMPWLTPLTARLGVPPLNAGIFLPAHPMTLLQELQAKLLSHAGSGTELKPLAMPAPVLTPAEPESPALAAPERTSIPRARQSTPASSHAAPAQKTPAIKSSRQGSPMQPFSQPNPAALSLTTLAKWAYFAIATVLLLRMAFGLSVTLRLWWNAVPVSPHYSSDIPAWLRLRASRSISSPLTVGSAILLPADYETWDREKFRIVLAHERSHIRQGDFYLQLLAGIYSALVWFSPLGWWLKRRLADLSEAISDRAGIEEARSRTSYAQILLEFAAAPRPTALGVPMARPGSLSLRIERLLNEQIFRQSFTGGRRRALVALTVVPLALFAATAMVRVQAAAHPAPFIWTAPAAAHTPAPDARPEPASAEIAQKTIQLTGVTVATVSDDSPAIATTSDTDTLAIAAPELATAKLRSNLLSISAGPKSIVLQSESGNDLSFDRTLTVGAAAQLIVTTGSGDIRLSRGSDHQIHIHAKIRVNRDGSEQQAREIAAHPPIEQTGDVVRVGLQHEQHWHGISISYQIEAPAGTLLAATSGSGDIVDEGVGRDAKLETGSGDIRAKGLNGSFVVKTGSGDITAEQIGQGDAKAETGSGDIEIKDIHGSFYGQTGSGDIKASGTPSAPWTLQTGSGNIEVWAGNAPLTLDASTGSGSVETDHEMLVKGSLNRHHVSGNLNGGGPLVKVQTGSGDVRVH